MTLITSTIFSWICGTGPSTICFPTSARPPVLSPDACPSVADDLTSNKRHDFLQDLRHWHIHDLLHDSFRHPLLRNHLDHVNDLLPDQRQRNSENCQVHQAHLFIVTLTQRKMKTCAECVFGEVDKHTCGVRPCSSCAPPAPRTGPPRARATRTSSSGCSSGSSCNKGRNTTTITKRDRPTIHTLACPLLPRTKNVHRTVMDRTHPERKAKL